MNVGKGFLTAAVTFCGMCSLRARLLALTFACIGLNACTAPQHFGLLPSPADGSSNVSRTADAPSGKGYRTIHNFKGGSDGAHATGGLTILDGVLYGVSSEGGGSGCVNLSTGGQGCGTVFSITASGEEKVLYRFKGGEDGAYPISSLSSVEGVLYGTTSGGGSACQCGTIFKVSTSGKEQILYRFKGGKDGDDPSGSLNLSKDVFYGTTRYGGGPCSYNHAGCGTFFSISLAGKEQVLYRFKGDTDGADPSGSLTSIDGGSSLYGVTSFDGYCRGGCGRGTVFKVTTSGKEQVLYRFGSVANDGWYPAAGLVAYQQVLYGTTPFGGTKDNGTVFEVTTSGKERIIGQFNGKDGARPSDTLIAVDGFLYGTTVTGGSDEKCTGGYYSGGCGVIFRINASGKEQVLYSFTGPKLRDGSNPLSGLTALNGQLYGTTLFGGDSSCSGPSGGDGCGTVYEISP